MEGIYDKFHSLFEEENKEETVKFVLEKLENREMNVIELYEHILTPALNSIKCLLEDKRICIWKEHIKSAIVRTIVECCYPYVIEQRNRLNYTKKGTSVVLCPPEEYHDIGARIASDFFTICGCDSIFVGSNTPYWDFFNAIDIIRPEIIAISVSNYYNLVVTKRIIEDIRKAIDYPFKVVVGGNAFKGDLGNIKLVGADYFAKTFEDISKIVGMR